MKGKKLLLLILGLVFLAVGFVGAKKYFFRSSLSPEQPLEDFLSSESATGSFTLTTTMPPVTEIVENAQFWIKGKKLRIDFTTLDGIPRASIISPDGSELYICDYNEGICFASALPIEQQILMFRPPENNGENLGVSDEEGCKIVHYSVQKTFSKPGAPNPMYVEDVTYCVTEERVVSFTTRDAFIEDDGSQSDFLVNHGIFDEVEVGLEIEDEIFELPLEISTSLN